MSCLLFRKSPFERTVDYGVARKIPAHHSREAATGALARGGAEGVTLGRTPTRGALKGRRENGLSTRLGSSPPRRKLGAVTGLVFVALAMPARAAEWSETAEVLWRFQPIVSYRAKLDGRYLVVEARHQPGWHTYAMDNKVRAAEKLAGSKSLGIDGPTEITVADGLEISGSWRQSPPNDYSKPELRWFSWGFEKSALFAAHVKTKGAGPAQITIRGQACDEKSCRNIELSLSLPLGSATGRRGEGVGLENLVEVRPTESTDAQ